MIVTSTGSQPNYTATALPPLAGRTRVKAVSAVPIHFSLTDADGAPISNDVAAELVAGDCRVHVSVAGAQELEPTCAKYDPAANKFQVIWKTARQPKGQVTVMVTVTSAGRTTSTEIAALELV